jgi:hypothetical protein
MSVDIDDFEPGTETDEMAGVTEIELSRAAARELYNIGPYEVHPERWERVREDIRFDDLVEEFEGTGHREVISCPFHGRDSKPSFHLYRRTNDAYCFGCCEGQKYYDAVRFVAAKMGCSRIEALRWIEKHYNLPPIADVRMDEEEEQGEIQILSFEDLTPYYITKASRDIATSRDVELAESYLRIFFEAKKENNPLPLARVLGREAVRAILVHK